tara:strand:+ start:1982 stop:2491 length:510 start_codon:yes stop_codon:yes gene_type:complete
MKSLKDLAQNISKVGSSLSLVRKPRKSKPRASVGSKRSRRHRSRKARKDSRHHRSRKARKVSHRRHGRSRKGGNAVASLVVPASLFAVQKLMSKGTSRKFVRKIDKKLGRTGKTIMKDITKGVSTTTRKTSRLLGLKRKQRRKTSKRKPRRTSRKSRRTSRKSRRTSRR